MMPWSRKWQPTPVFLPGESQGQRSLEGYSPWDCKESGMTEQLKTHTSMAAPGRKGITSKRAEARRSLVCWQQGQGAGMGTCWSQWENFFSAEE